MKKAIEHILHGKEKHITEEETVLQPLPHIQFRFANPFIVLHHAGPKVILPGSKSRIYPHPHRGFSPVTFIVQGEGFHKDNAGHDETVKEGDAQWMFAGKGLLHSEGPTDHILNTGGIQEFIQIWVNAPKANKWDEPFYKAARKAEQPQVLMQEGVNLHLVSGNYDGKTGVLQSFTPVISVIGEISEGKEVRFSATPGYWALLYIIAGDVIVNGEQEVEMHNLIVFEKGNDEFVVKAKKDAKVLFLSAEPIDEPVAAKDNFVMNTPEEIEQAFADYKNGVFGTLDY